jgi:hypothetical protein
VARGGRGVTFGGAGGGGEERGVKKEGSWGEKQERLILSQR